MNTDLKMEKSPVEMIEILPADQRKSAAQFIELGEALNCKSRVRFATAHKTWKCVFSKKKPARVLFTVECAEDRWQVKALLSHLEQYKSELDHCSENLVQRIKNAYDCRKCNERCKGPNPFVLDGVTYRKCFGCGFYFSELDETDRESLLALIKQDAHF